MGGGATRDSVINLPTGPFNIVYADPPWQFTCWAGDRGARTAESHYRTMRLADVCAMSVKSICAPDCALFLWVPSSMLPEGFRVIESWGFKYKTVAFVWVKRTRITRSFYWGMGHYTRSGAEICLLATKGRLPRISRSVHQVVEGVPQRHSAKPNEVRKRVVDLYGDVPRIELFAREQHEGWTVWGDDPTLEEAS